MPTEIVLIRGGEKALNIIILNTRESQRKGEDSHPAVPPDSCKKIFKLNSANLLQQGHGPETSKLSF